MNNSFPILDQYINYMQIVLGRSELTVKEYRYDLIKFFRWLKQDRKLSTNDNIDSIDISDISSSLIDKITTDDLLAYLIWLNQERKLTNTSRARKVAALRSFFKYVHSKKHIISSNPAYDLEVPKKPHRNPKHLTLEESKKLLMVAHNSTTLSNERDYCMLTLFLNCGMRLNELRNIDIQDIRETTLQVVGKGDKERTVYLNNACLEAIDNWLKVRSNLKLKPEGRNALFVSKRGTRISDDMIQIVVKRLLGQAGIDTRVFSVHKLRHTAATLMYKYGQVDIRNLQKILGHASVSTTQIYTHVDEEQLQEAVNKNPLSNFIPNDND